MKCRVAAYGEDFAHESVVGAVVERVAADHGVDVKVEWRGAAGGRGRVVSGVAEFRRNLAGSDRPDLLVVATDANCKGYRERVRELSIDDSEVPVSLAIPDPHIERWLLLDPGAFRAVLGRGCDAPDRKCVRGRYKAQLRQAVSRAGAGQPPLAGLEYATDIVQNMDLRRVSRLDPSFRRFVESLQRVFRQRRT